tara:strand:+ start:1493 stop:2056 length:564 start_codon:yes stop_codon:yes gene_type:complete
MGRSILNEPEVSTGDKLVKIHYHKYSTRHGLSNSANGVIWRTGTFTTTTDNATFVIKGQIWGRHHAADHCGVFCQLLDSSNNNVVSGADNTDGARYQGIGYAGVNSGNSWAKFLLAWHQIYTGLSAGTYKVLIGWSPRNGGQERPFSDWNINNNDDGRAHQHDSHCEIWELKNSQGLNNQNLSVGVW